MERRTTVYERDYLTKEARRIVKEKAKEDGTVLIYRGWRILVIGPITHCEVILQAYCNPKGSEVLIPVNVVL